MFSIWSLELLKQILIKKIWIINQKRVGTFSLSVQIVSFNWNHPHTNFFKEYFFIHNVAYTFKNVYIFNAKYFCFNKCISSTSINILKDAYFRWQRRICNNPWKRVKVAIWVPAKGTWGLVCLQPWLPWPGMVSQPHSGGGGGCFVWDRFPGTVAVDSKGHRDRCCCRQ